MAQKRATERRRPPGSLRLVTKKAKGKSYQRWQWRTHRRTDTGWRTGDVELGEHLTGMRTRVLVALGDLKAPLLIERTARWELRSWDWLPSWTGQPAHARKHQRSAWWIEPPRKAGDSVRLRFRNLGSPIDFRTRRPLITEAEADLTWVWERFTDDPLIELARLQWQEQEAQQRADQEQQDLTDLKRRRRKGEISQRDFDADERMILISVDGWENVISRSAARYDSLLQEVIESMPRPSRDQQQTRILALVDRHLNDPKQRQRWQADQWDDGTLTWWPAG